MTAAQEAQIRSITDTDSAKATCAKIVTENDIALSLLRDSVIRLNQSYNVFSALIIMHLAAINGRFGLKIRNHVCGSP